MTDKTEKDAEANLKEFLTQAEHFIEDNELGLNIEQNEEVVKTVSKLLKLQPYQMYQMDNIDQIPIMIGQYCLYMQTVRTKLENTIEWCTYYINAELAEEWKSEVYNFIPKEMKPHSIASTNPFITKLMEMRLVAESRLKGIPENISTLQNIAYRLGQKK